jgi:hypothetical protein
MFKNEYRRGSIYIKNYQFLSNYLNYTVSSYSVPLTAILEVLLMRCFSHLTCGIKTMMTLKNSIHFDRTYCSEPHAPRFADPNKKKPHLTSDLLWLKVPKLSPLGQEL